MVRYQTANIQGRREELLSASRKGSEMTTEARYVDHRDSAEVIAYQEERIAALVAEVKRLKAMLEAQ